MSEDTATTPPESAESHLRVRPDEVLFFNRQLASMARLNIPIAKGLRILGREQRKDSNFRRLIEAIQHDLEQGVSLREALAKFPGVFSGMHLEIIKAGEATGNLAVILEELNSHTESMQRIRARIVEAVTYPAVISTVIFGFVLFFLMFVAPQFQDMLLKRSVMSATDSQADAWAQLPVLTRILFTLSDLVHNPILFMLLLGATIGAVVYVFRRISEMGEKYDDMLFRVPVFGGLFENAALMKVTRTMRDLLTNGVSMVETLRLVAGTVGRNRIERKLTDLRMAVEEGGSFSRDLAGGDVFPDTMVWKLQMAEEKGIIEEALGELASDYEVRVDQQTTLITKLLSPLLLVAMGVVVFMMFLACFVPLTNIYN